MRVPLGLEERINIYFIVAGHAENVCDGAFRLMECKILTTEVEILAEVM